METYTITDGSVIQRGIIYEIHCINTGFFTISGIIHDAQSISGRQIRGPFIVKNPVTIKADPAVSLIIFMESTTEFEKVNEMQYLEFPCNQSEVNLPLTSVKKIDLIATAESIRNIYRINSVNQKNFMIKVSDKGEAALFAAAFPRGAGSRIENYILTYDTDFVIEGILHTSAASISSHRVGYYCCEPVERNNEISALGLEIPDGKHHIILEDDSVNHIRIAGAPGTIAKISSPELRIYDFTFTEDILDVKIPIPEEVPDCHEFYFENSDTVYLEVGLEK